MYGFEYAGDGSQILARMAVDSNTPASFSLLMPEQVQQWAQGAAVEPVGRGSANTFFGDDLVWTGSFKTPGTYYIVVQEPDQSASNHSCSLTDV